MKKNSLYLIFVLLFSINVIGQTNIRGKYIIESHNKIKAANSTFGDGCRNDAVIDIVFSNNISKRILDVDLNSVSSGTYTDYGIRFDSIDAYPDITPLKMVTSASRNWKRALGGCGGNGSFNGSIREKTISFCENIHVNNDAIRWWNHELKIDIYPKLIIINSDPNNNFLATDHKTQIVSHIGFAPSEYKWEYKTSSMGNFGSLPQFDGQSAINVNAVDILGTNVDNYIGQFIEIRQMSTCGNYSNIVTYKILKSAPKVINHGPSVKTTCYDANDGQYRLYFDRPLDSSANEYISIGLTGTVNGQPVDVDFTNITALETDNSYNLTGLSAGNYELKIYGKYNGENNYSETTVTPITITIEKNTPVDFTITKTDVWCYQGTDGQLHITASGGTQNGYEYQLNGGNWIPFSDPASFTQTIDGLVEGNYTLKVRDSNACVAKIQVTDQYGNIGLGAEKELSLTLTAPQQPLTIDYTLVQEPTFNGATNGKLVAKIDGGTIFDNNSYWYEWKNAQGQTIPATTQFTSGSYYITLDQIPSGFYYLTIRDKNYTDATDKNNCTIIESEIELTQPEPLTAVIELVQPISCHVENEFGDETDMEPNDGQRDESQDGILKVVAEGGKPFTGNNNGGKPYKYTWKKQNSDGSWSVLPVVEDTLPLLSDGNYAVNVEDANGIIIGIYQNNDLVEPTDVVYYLQQPEKLVLVLESLPATCAGGDGSVKAIVTGGTAPYTYSWTNGETTAEMTNLSAMPYSVNITDARGCRVEGTIVVAEPDHIEITETIIPLLCYNASDAEIDVQVTGGTAPYTYLWNTGATTNKISQLPHGTYTVTITDAQGCSYIRTYTIENPKELVIDLGEDRTLCNGQTLVLDAEIVDEPGTTYNWTSTNGFVSNQSKVELIDPGTYTVTATTPNGCIVTDTVVITRSNLEIDAEFLLTTQAFVNEEVILVNVSNPKGKTTQWFIPDSDAITVNDESDDYITLNFAEKGNYTITLMQTQGDCYELFDKEIIVEENNGQYNPVNANAGFIKEFTVAPNPNNGNFDVIVKLEDAGPVSLRLFNLSGQAVQSERKLPASKVHSVNYNISLPASTYILILETQYQVLTKKLIIY